MRETRQSGSEGGGTGTAGSPYPYQSPCGREENPKTESGRTGRAPSAMRAACRRFRSSRLPLVFWESSEYIEGHAGGAR